MLDSSPRSIAQHKFALKNQDRKECRLANKKDYRNGRHARKLVTHNGAFGDREAKVWNLLIIGTKGLTKDVT